MLSGNTTGDRLSLDRRGLNRIPRLGNESKLRLLSLQHNMIVRLDGLQSRALTSLVFLDLYENQIERLSGLEPLLSLRVLLLGKNRIRKIEALSTLIKLEVLDLHGNQIQVLNGLSSLHSLKVLNMAGNQLRQICSSELQGLKNLQELNLRRNRLRRIQGFSETLALQKLFLSNNELQMVDNLATITQAQELREVTIDGNPVALGGDCISFLVSHLAKLQLLSNMEVTEAVRRAAQAWRTARETPSSAENTTSNARYHWKLLRGRELTPRRVTNRESSDRVQSDSGISVCSAPSTQRPRSKSYRRQSTSVLAPTVRLPPILDLLDSQTRHAESGQSSSVEPLADSSLSSLPSNSSSEADEASASEADETPLCPIEVVTRPNQRNRMARSASACHRVRRSTLRRGRANTARPPPVAASNSSSNNYSSSTKVREQGGDFLVEISGKCLNVYGQTAIRFLDRPWSAEKANQVTIVKLNYVDFDSAVGALGRLRSRFPTLDELHLAGNNLHCLGQLNALADLQGLTALTIDPEGNPLTSRNWQTYALYRLHHWGLRILNGNEVTEDNIKEADRQYAGLSALVLWSLPEHVLEPLLQRLRLDEKPPNSAKKWIFKADAALRSVVAKEALQWRKGGPLQEDIMWRNRARVQLNNLVDRFAEAARKQNQLRLIWNNLLEEMIRDTLVDYTQLHAYMRKCLAQISDKM